MTKLELNTFGDLSKKTKEHRGTSKEVIINADRALFAQMMIIALPSSPLGPCSADGSLRKPNKASLAKELQKKNMTAAEMIPQPCTRIWTEWQ